MTPLGMLIVPVAVALFVAPGYLLRRFTAPRAPSLTVWIGALAFWWTLAMAAEWIGLPMTRAGVLGIGMVCGLPALFMAWRSGVRTWRVSLRGNELWIAIAALGVLSVLVRTWIDPLSGWDASWRWDELARRVVEQGSLAGYPPVSTEDFERYGWPDGIPPLASLTSAWFYLFHGHTDPLALLGRTAVELAGIGWGLQVLARRLWKEDAAWPAVALASTSAIVLWSIGMQQEIGLMILAVVALFALLPDSGDADAAVFAGLAGGLAAVSREYGVAFAGLGAVLLFLRPATRGVVWHYIAAAAVIAGPWGARNLLLTGNPLYPQSVGGLFPAPLAYSRFMSATREFWAWGAGPGTAMGWMRPMGFGGGLVAVFAVAAIGMRRPARTMGMTVGLAIALGLALWAWSTPNTAGGRGYGLRVLGPTLALAAALGAGVYHSVSTQLLRRLLLGLTVLFAVDAARRSWLLPVRGSDPIWNYTWQPWAELDAFFTQAVAEEDNSAIIARAADRLVVFDDVRLQRRIRLDGQRATSLMDPRMAPAFLDELDFNAQRDLITQDGVALLVLTAGDPLCAKYFAQVAFFRELRARYRANEIVAGREVYDLDALVAREP